MKKEHRNTDEEHHQVVLTRGSHAEGRVWKYSLGWANRPWDGLLGTGDDVSHV